MYLVDFIYDGLKLSNYGCMVGNVVNSGDTALNMGSVINLETVINHGTYTTEIVNADYPDVYTVTFDIFKKRCGSGEKEYFEDKEIVWFMKWLNRKEYHKFVPIYDDGSEFYNIFFMGVFTECKAISIGGRVYGFSLNLTTNSPFAYLDYKPYSFTISSTTTPRKIIINGTETTVNCGSFPFYNISEEIGAIYPENFTVRLLQAGNLIINNDMDGQSRYTEVRNCFSGETITFDCKHKVITSNDETAHNKFYNDFNYVFPRLMSTFKKSLNTFYLSLRSEVTIDYKPIRKVGVFV